MNRLQLSNGSKWLIEASLEMRPWLKKMTDIMMLNSVEAFQEGEHSRIFFCLRDKRIKKGKKSSPLNNKTVHDSRFARFWSEKNTSHFTCEIPDKRDEISDILAMWMSQCIFHLHEQKSGGLPLHAALLEHKKEGILLIGPSGCGKTTLCRNLPSSWKALSDDQSLIVKGKNGGYSVHPLPTWSEYMSGRSENRWKIEESFPVKALFFLEKSDKCEIVPLLKERAALKTTHASMIVHHFSLWNRCADEERRIRKEIFHNSCELVKDIPSYTLRSNIADACWDEMSEVLSQ